MVIIYLLITVLVLIAVSGLVSDLLEEFLVSQRTRTQLQETTRLALEIAPELQDTDVDALFEYIEERAYSLGGRVLVLDSDAVVQIDSASRHNGLLLPYPEVREVLRDGKESSYGFHYISGSAEESVFSNNEQSKWAVYYTAPIVLEGAHVGAVLFSASIQDVVDSLNDVTHRITLIFTVVILIVIALIFILSGWITKPIVELTSAIRKMGTQGYVRVNAGGSGEIAELGLAFNRMSERIEDHDRTRDEFVANASHELKTPLATMKILSESILYQDNPDPAMMKEFFGDVNHEVDRLSRIVTELLRLVQEDQGRNALNFTEVRLDSLVSNICNRLNGLAEKKNISLNVDLVPVTIEGDSLRLEQVAVNIIENAIKYTDEGHVDVTVTDEEDWALITVSDTGIGIPEESVEHLFERFYRVDKARSRSTGGTGLGLSITEKIVTLHGGSISVKSKLGEGSRFTVSLPVKQQDRGTK